MPRNKLLEYALIGGSFITFLAGAAIGIGNGYEKKRILSETPQVTQNSSQGHSDSRVRENQSILEKYDSIRPYGLGMLLLGGTGSVCGAMYSFERGQREFDAELDKKRRKK